SSDTETDIKNTILSYDSTERIAHFFILGAFLFISLIAMWRYPMPINLKFYYTLRTKFLGFLVSKKLIYRFGGELFS
ncbi:hypothetical protein OCA99_29800, partial [Bacillus cereus]|nr:hypothetical protein [Bacillus cereus]